VIRHGRVWFRFLLAGSGAIAVAAVAGGDRVFTFSHLLRGSVVQLYVLQFQRALVALPFLLAWIRVSRHPSVRAWLSRVWRCLLGHRLAPLPELVLFAGLACLAALVAYHGIPTGDSTRSFFLTRVLAQGRLFAPAPVYPEFFPAPMVVQGGKWYPELSPGHSLVLLPAYLLKATWLVGPLLGVLSLWLFFQLVSIYCDRRTARWALLFGALSPALVFLFGSHELHTTSVSCTLLAVFAIVRNGQARRWFWGLVAGVGLGILFLTRPYTALAVGLPLLLYVLLRQPRALPLLMLAGVVPVAAHLWYNQAVTGHWYWFPYQMMGSRIAVGFSSAYGDRTFGMTGHSPLKALINFGYQALTLAMQLHGWLFLSLLSAVAGLATARWRRSLLLWLPAAALVIAYVPYWFHGVTTFGPKCWSEAFPAFIVLTALGIRSAPVRLRRLGVAPDLVLRVVSFLVGYSLMVYLPTELDYLAKNRWGETPKVGRQVARAGIHDALVFIHTDKASGSFDYTSAFILNDPLLQGDVVYALDLGPDRNPRLMAQYPGRSYYRYDFLGGALSAIASP